MIAHLQFCCAVLSTHQVVILLDSQWLQFFGWQNKHYSSMAGTKSVPYRGNTQGSSALARCTKTDDHDTLYLEKWVSIIWISINIKLCLFLSWNHVINNHPFSIKFNNNTLFLKKSAVFCCFSLYFLSFNNIRAFSFFVVMIFYDFWFWQYHFLWFQTVFKSSFSCFFSGYGCY